MDAAVLHRPWPIPDGSPRHRRLAAGTPTYEVFAGYWPTVTDRHDPIAAALNERPKYVASTTMKVGSWKRTTILEGDLATAVSELKTDPGRAILVIGWW